MTLRTFFSVLLFMANLSFAFSQSYVRGTDFYFAFSGSADLLAYSYDEYELSVHFRNVETYPIDVKIESQGEVLLDETFTLPSNRIPDYYSFPKEYVLDLPREQVLNYGIHISTSSDITVTAKIEKIGTMETTKILPLKSLGTEYMILSTPGNEFINYANDTIRREGQLIVVATENNTEVEIIPNFDSESGNPKGELIKVTLDEGQSYEIRPEGSEVDITGTAIKSCAPIAVFSGATGSKIPIETDSCCVDVLWEQMIPVEKWGKKFYTVPPLSPRGDVLNLYSIKAVAAKDNTSIFVNGEMKTTINAGEYYLQNDLEEGAIVQANKPILLAEFLYTADLLGEPLNSQFFLFRLGDPSMVILQPAEARTNRYLSNPMVLNLPNQEGYAMTAIILKEADIPFLNRNIDDDYTIFSYAYDDDYICAITEDNGIFESSRKFQIYEYFLGDYESYFHSGTYAYPLTLPQPVELDIPSQICINESLTATLSNSVASESYEYAWDFGNGDTGTGNPTDYTYSESGEYEINVLVEYENCESYEFIDTILVIGDSSPDFLIEGDSAVVLFDTLLYTVPVAATSEVEWKIIGGQILLETQNTVQVIWNTNDSENVLFATEITEEGCTGATDNFEIEILDIQINDERCFGSLVIAPNPVGENLNFSTVMLDADIFTFRIFNSIGQLVENQEATVNRGNTNLAFDVRDYPAGVYFLNVDNGNCRETIKWVKMR